MTLALSDQPARAANRRQIILVLALLAAISSALLIAYLVLFRTTYETLFTDLRPADAAVIVADLDKHKTPYRLKDGGRTILVPANLVDATRLSVVNSDLPLKGAVGFELFNKSDIGLTEFAQKINYQRALQGELARTIMTMDAVDSARVHLSLPDPTIFRDDRRPPKASVTLLPRSGQTIPAQTVWGVQRLISAAVPDLEAANVVVLDERGVVVSSDPRDGGAQPVSTIEAPLSIKPGPQVAPAAPAVQPARDADAHSDGGSALGWSLGILLFLLLLLGLGPRLLRPTQRARTLSYQERQRFAARLKGLLDEEEPDGART